MIKYNPKIWLGHIFIFYKSDTLKILLPEMFVMGVYAFGIAYIELNWLEQLHTVKNAMTVHSMIGIVLSLLLVFRTNSAYDRWWEGRRQLGQLVNASRNAANKIQVLVTDETARLELKTYLLDFPLVLKHHLAGNNGEDTTVPNKHLPSDLVGKMYGCLKKLLDQKKITGEEYLSLDRELAQLLEITGSCERIKGTPIPFSYNTFIKKFIFIYSFTLPIGLVPDFSYWTVPISIFVFYVLVSLEILAEEIEDPFGGDENDLPVEEIAERIRANVGEMIS
jgi:putative membrane protein